MIILVTLSWTLSFSCMRNKVMSAVIWDWSRSDRSWTRKISTRPKTAKPRWKCSSQTKTTKTLKNNNASRSSNRSNHHPLQSCHYSRRPQSVQRPICWALGSEQCRRGNSWIHPQSSPTAKIQGTFWAISSIMKRLKGAVTIRKGLLLTSQPCSMLGRRRYPKGLHPQKLSMRFLPAKAMLSDHMSKKQDMMVYNSCLEIGWFSRLTRITAESVVRLKISTRPGSPSSQSKQMPSVTSQERQPNRSRRRTTLHKRLSAITTEEKSRINRTNRSLNQVWKSSRDMASLIRMCSRRVNCCKKISKKIMIMSAKTLISMTLVMMTMITTIERSSIKRQKILLKSVQILWAIFSLIGQKLAFI